MFRLCRPDRGFIEERPTRPRLQADLLPFVGLGCTVQSSSAPCCCPALLTSNPMPNPRALSMPTYTTLHAQCMAGMACFIGRARRNRFVLVGCP